MKKVIAIILAFSLLLLMAACAQPPVSDPVPPEPSTSDPEIQKNPASLWIECNGETVIPYEHFVWSDSYDEDGSGLCADGEPASLDDQSFMDSLPGVSYTGDFEIFLDENVSSSGFTVYDMDHSEVLRGSKFSSLNELPAGEYIVEISIMVRGDYVESVDRYNASGYECWFRLSVPA